ncbi:hypothetical protein AUP42_10795 [Thalassospira lucentensis]|uniref:Uncharacterized protein n=1 Tax=Thalassospira lucentensis TaxID=168935 RepID=A0A154L9D3_9PROT|nr:hypothetical protein AUP42_10795 [Thalassospira lucentensis]
MASAFGFVIARIRVEIVSGKIFCSRYDVVSTAFWFSIAFWWLEIKQMQPSVSSGGCEINVSDL